MRKINKIASLGLVASTILMAGTALGSASSRINVSITNDGFTPSKIVVTSSNGTSWTTIEPKDLVLTPKIAMAKDNHEVRGYMIRQGDVAFHMDIFHQIGLFVGAPHLFRQIFPPEHTEESLNLTVPVMASTTAFTLAEQQQILNACNSKLGVGRGIGQTHNMFGGVELTAGAYFVDDSVFGSGENYSYESAHASMPVPIECKGVRSTPGQLVAQEPDFDIKDLKMFLSTFTGNETQPNQFRTCKRARILVRAETSKAGPVKLRLWSKIGDAAMQSELIETWASFDGHSKHTVDISKWVTVENTSYMQAKVEELGDGTFPKEVGWKGINVPCETTGSGDDYAPTPTNDPEVPATNVTGKIFLAPKIDPVHNGSHRGTIVLRLESAKPGNTAYKLTCSGGREWSASVPTSKQGSKHVGNAIHRFRFSETTEMGCALRSTTMAGDPVIAIASHVYKVPGRSPNLPVGAGNPSLGKSKPTHTAEDKKRPSKFGELKRKRQEAKKAATLKKRRDQAKKAAILKKRRDQAKKLAIAKRKREAANKVAKIRRQKQAAKKAAIVKKRRMGTKKNLVIRIKPRRQRATK